MNDALDVICGRRAGRGGSHRRVGDVGAAGVTGDQCRRELSAPRIRPDARAPLSDAVSRLRRRPRAARLAEAAHLADGSGAHAGVARRRGAARGRGAAARRHDHGADDGDGARHRCGVRSAGADGPARGRRQVHDGRRSRRCRRGCSNRPPRRSTRAWRWRRAGTGAPTAGCGRRSRRASRVSCSRELLEAVGALSRRARAARAHARVGEPRRDRARALADRPRRTSPISTRRPGLAAALSRALRVGGRGGAAAARRARRSRCCTAPDRT